jgi:hypothetical protein
MSSKRPKMNRNHGVSIAASPAFQAAAVAAAMLVVSVILVAANGVML